MILSGWFLTLTDDNLNLVDFNLDGINFREQLALILDFNFWNGSFGDIKDFKTRFQA